MKSKPSPTDLTLLEIGLQYVDIGWNNLTVVSVRHIGVDECVELVRRAPRLEAITLEAIDGSSSIFPMSDTRIVHPHLRSLEIWDIWDINEDCLVAAILDSVCLPSLEQWTHDRSPYPLGNMISFIGCSSSCLKTLKFDMKMVDYRPVTRLLHHSPSLEFLVLRIGAGSPSDPADELLNVLCASARSPQFFPCLQPLEIIRASTSFPGKTVPQIFALSHWQSLKVKINIRHADYLHMREFMVPFQELVDKGFDLIIVGHGETDLLQEHMWHSGMCK